jgi:hypothetical protein
VKKAANCGGLRLVNVDRRYRTVRAIAQAHTAFSRAAFGAVLFTNSGIERQRGN